MTLEWLEAHGHVGARHRRDHGAERRQPGQHRARRPGRGRGPRPVPGDRPGAVGRTRSRARRALGTATVQLHGTGRRAGSRPGWRPGATAAAGHPELSTGGSRCGERAYRPAGPGCSVRYFDDRILLTDTHAWAYFRRADGVLRVHDARGAGGAGDQHHGRARGDPDDGRGGAPADRAAAVRGGRLGDQAGRDLRRRARLAGLPGGDVPARLGQGLLDQGGLPRRPARPARRARAAIGRRLQPSSPARTGPASRLLGLATSRSPRPR